jgi:quercetin dioxygenase-like cupin family protein
MIHFTHWREGKLFGVLNHFEKEGDALPIHEHDHFEAHNVIVLEGAVRIEYEDGNKEHFSGEIVKIKWNVRHTVRALTDNARTLHLYLYGEPYFYTSPAVERVGTLDGVAAWNNS